MSNSSSNIANASIFLDDDGTTYDESTNILWNVPIYPNMPPLTVEVNICMNNSSGNVAVKTDTASALTFTVSGMEKT